MSLVKLSDYVVDTIARKTGARHVFMLSGGMAMHLVESFGSHPLMTTVPMHHEQAAGIAASAYGRVLGVPGVVVVTAGPGALNAVTPCAGAYMESVPLVVVSGQVSRANSRQGHEVRQRGIQEAEIVDVVRPITKYAVKIEDTATVHMHLEWGLRAAVSGRPGPVWFDIPVDVQAAMIDTDAFQIDESLADAGKEVLDPALFDGILKEIRSAKRPLLILGHGIRLAGVADQARSLVEMLGIPFQTTWNGMDLVGDEHPLSFGRANVFGPRYANLIVQNADLVLAIGARFGIQHTGYNVEGFCRGARLIMVDVDEEEMHKPGLKVSRGVIMDAGRFVRGMIASLANETSSTKRGAPPDWLSYCIDVRDRFPPLPRLEEVADQAYVEPKYFIDRLSEAMPPDAIFPFGSSGMGHTVTGGNFRCKFGQRVFTFKGLAAMGYGLPCAVGAAFASGRSAYTLIGEGGLQLNLHTLQTIKHFSLKVKIIVFNNGGYHSIHMTQNAFFKGHYVGSGPESGVTFPPLEGLAELYSMKYFRVASNQEVDTILGDFIREPGPAFLEVIIDPNKALEPRIVSVKLPDGSMVSRPLEDMAPLLDRGQLAKLMYIPLLDL